MILSQLLEHALGSVVRERLIWLPQAANVASSSARTYLYAHGYAHTQG